MKPNTLVSVPKCFTLNCLLERLNNVLYLYLIFLEFKILVLFSFYKLYIKYSQLIYIFQLQKSLLRSNKYGCIYDIMYPLLFKSFLLIPCLCNYSMHDCL